MWQEKEAFMRGYGITAGGSGGYGYGGYGYSAPVTLIS